MSIECSKPMSGECSKPMSGECSKLTLLDYIKLHRPTVDGETNCCWDCSDTVFDAVVTVDCSVDRDGKVDIIDDKDDEYPHMPLFIREFLSKVEVKSLLGDGTPIIDVDGLIRRNLDTVRQWIAEHWNGSWDNEDDIVYQMIQEIHYAIAGYKGEKGYTAYYKLFKDMVPVQKTERTIPDDILTLWEQTICEIRDEIKSWDVIGPHTKQYATGLCDKLERSMCALAGGPYNLRYSIGD